MGQAKEVVETAYGAFARGDIPAVLEVMSEDVDWSVPEAVPQGMTTKGRDGVGGFFQGLGERWEDFGIDIETIVDGGDTAVGLGVAKGNLKGVGPASYGFVHVFEVADGQVVRFREYVDPDETLRGAATPAGSGATAS